MPELKVTMRSFQAILFAALALLCGCMRTVSWKSAGLGSSGKPLHAFPEKARLAELAAQPNPPLPVDLVNLEEWQLELRAPDPQSPTHSLLTIVTPSATASPALDCVAAELARAMLVSPHKHPSPGLRRFVSARCGALVALPAVRIWQLDAPAPLTEAAFLEQLRPRLTQPIDQGATLAGVALVSSGGRAIVVVASGTPAVSIEPFEQVVGTDGKLKIRGHILFETDAMSALVNAGEWGVKRCELDRSFPAPAFALSCPLAPGDDHAWVQLMALPRGRVIAHEVLNVIALRHEQAALSYRAQRVGEPRPIQDGKDFPAVALELVNGVRRGAAIEPIRLAREQSSVASSVTPALFAAMLSEEQSQAARVDQIALGLLAGWDVTGGTIRGGNLITGLSVETLDAGRWLAAALELPVGRAVLLDPKVHKLALGVTLQQQPPVLAAVALTYTFFEEEVTPGERAAAVLDRLRQVRQARKLGRTYLVEDAPGMQEELNRVRRGEVVPAAALQTLMLNMSRTVSREVRGLVWETQDLDAIEFPKELLQPGDLAIGVGVTYYRAKGGAWGQYSVLFIVVRMPSGMRA
jgi:hypothetical protein